MAYAFIHGEVKGSGASVEFKGNGLDLLDLTIQIVGSVVAEVPEPLRPYVIKKIQDKIPDAVQNDLEAQGKAAPAEKKESLPLAKRWGSAWPGSLQRQSRASRTSLWRWPTSCRTAEFGGRNMNCNVKITAVGTADGLEVSIHGGSVGMMTAAELIVARVLMAVADDEENLAGLKDSMFEIINEMVKDCWAEKTAKTEAEKEAAVNQLKAFVAMFFEPEN